MVAQQVVGFSNLRKGQLFGLDPSDGEGLWRGEPRWGEHASLIAWGNQVLVFLEDGSLVVGEVSQGGFRSLRKYPLGESRALRYHEEGTYTMTIGKVMWAHPAIVDSRASK